MGNLIEEALETMRAGLPVSLVPPECVPRLWRIASCMAPISKLRIGLECRLGAGADTVDIQQGIHSTNGEPVLLAEQVNRLMASAEGPLHLIWSRVSAFAAAWRDQSYPSFAHIDEFWMEFDDPASAANPAPSVFIGLRRNAPKEETRSAVEIALEMLLGEPLNLSVREHLATIFEACTDHAFVRHVGLMLSRKDTVVRVNVADLRCDQIDTYLSRVEWPGPRDELSAINLGMFCLVDVITLCFDVGEQISSNIGLECFLEGRPPDRRWKGVLDELVARKLCTSEKREALIAWPRQVDPATSHVSWPAALIGASFYRPVDQFGVILQHLNHIKISLSEHRVVEAKAYFGITHEWMQVECKENKPGPRPYGRRKRKSLAGQRSTHNSGGERAISDSIEKAVSFLIDSRTLAGWWLDFPTMLEGSDEWVTAFVGSSLASINDARARHVALHAWLLLSGRRHRTGGWGYNALLPVDTDGTTWGLRLAAAIGTQGSQPAKHARRVLAAHLLPDGGLPSYREDVLSHSRESPTDGALSGWCRIAHPCITAAAAILEDGRPRDYLRRTQHEAGHWSGYWWEDDEYTTVLAAEALASRGDDKDRTRVDAAIRWAAFRISATGAVHSASSGSASAFATASCLRMLALGGGDLTHQEERRRAVAWLLEQQEEDGSWRASALMRVPGPEVLNPAGKIGPDAIYLDEEAIFTTALTVAALEAARNR
jgi:hypothetical protein